MTEAPLTATTTETPLTMAAPRPRAPWNALNSAAGLALLAAIIVVPVQIYGGDKYQLPLYTKYLAVALFALSVDLIWGYTGLLSLGQGLFFGIGAYAMGYSLILQQAATGMGRPLEYGADMALPDFMMQCRLEHVPFWIGPLINVWLALAVAVVLPTLVALLLGAVVFRRGIKGVYFSLLTQALLMAVFMLISTMRPYTGGVDGLTNLASLKLFGIDFEMILPRKPPQLALYYVIAGALAVCFLACGLLMASKVGRLLTAIRDNENRVLALGYNTALYKTFIFSLSGFLAGLAGALFVAANGSAGPQFFGIAESIEIVIMVAVGGRGTLIGPILGAVLVGAGKTFLNDKFKLNDLVHLLNHLVEMVGLAPIPDAANNVPLWPIALGALFIAVVLFLPDGIVGGGQRLARWIGDRFTRKNTGNPVDTENGTPQASTIPPPVVDQAQGGAGGAAAPSATRG